VRTRTITLAAFGDANFGDGVGAVMDRRGALFPWQGVAPTLRAADIAFGNLECAISDRGFAVPKEFRFRGRPEHLAQVVRFAGLDVLARVLVARAATDGVTTRGAPYERKGGRRRIDEALALQVARLGPDHPEVATVLALGAQSSDDWERVLAIRRRPGASPWLLGLSLLEAGTSMASFGTPVEVRAALAESVALLSAPGVTPTPALGEARDAYREVLLLGDSWPTTSIR